MKTQTLEIIAIIIFFIMVGWSMWDSTHNPNVQPGDCIIMASFCSICIGFIGKNLYDDFVN